MAERTLLQLATEFCNRVGLPIPVSVQNATDDTTKQVLGLMNEGIQSICDRYKLQQLTTSGSFQHAAGTDYGAVNFTTVATGLADWKYNEPFTLWSGSNRLPVYGPLSIQEWQRLLQMAVATATYQYIVYGNWLRIYPVPTVPASVTFYVFYQSKYGVLGAAGAVQESYVLDGDMPRIPSYLVLADLKWRWKKEKGLPYAEDQRDAEAMLVNMVGRSPLPALNLDGGDINFGPKIVIQPGSWMVP